jgi:hypothetical protein
MIYPNDNRRSVQGTYFLLSLLIMEETRSHIILRRIAKKLCKETGDDRYRVRGEETRPKLSTMIKISCTRPISTSFDDCYTRWCWWRLVFVLTEPIVTSICVGSLSRDFLLLLKLSPQLWVFFMSGVLYVQIGYVNMLFTWNQWGVAAKQFEQISVWSFQAHLSLQRRAEWIGVHYRHVSVPMLRVRPFHAVRPRSVGSIVGLCANFYQDALYR